jgi:hypothetical protein
MILLWFPTHAGVLIMTKRAPIIVEPDISARLDQLHGLYGRDQTIPDILDGLNTRLVRARQLYGGDRSIPAIVNGLYEKLEQLRLLYGLDQTIEEILDGIISRKTRLNRLVELQSEVMVTIDEHEEIQLIQRQFARYVYNLARQKRNPE